MSAENKIVLKNGQLERHTEKGVLALVCPFRAPMAIPNRLGTGFELVNSPCGMNCPHFEDRSDEGKVVLHCRGYREEIVLHFPKGILS